jgi:hypothetical protein
MPLRWREGNEVAFPPPDPDTDHPHARWGTLPGYNRCILFPDQTHTRQQLRDTDSLGTGLFLGHHRKADRDIQPWLKTELLPGETARQRLKIPRLAGLVREDRLEATASTSASRRPAWP